MLRRILIVVSMNLFMFTIAIQVLNAGAKGQITVYMSPDSLAAEMESVFEKEYGNVLTIISGPWCRKLRAEMEAGEIKADVIYGAEPMLYMMLKDSGQLLQYWFLEAGSVKPEYRIGEGYFTIADARYAIIVYNKHKVMLSNAPSTWDDLLDPEWKGRVAIPDATLCASAFAITCGLVQVHDFCWEFFEALKKEDTMLVGKAVKVAGKVASGEALVGIVPQDGVVRMIKKARKQGVESPLVMVWPADGAVSIPRPIAIIRDENRIEASTNTARRFVDFVLSIRGQRIVTKYGFITVRKDLSLLPPGVPMEINATEINWKWAHNSEKALRDKFESIFYGR